MVNQQGVSFLVGTWGDAFVSGDLAYLQLRETHDARPGANLKLTQPLNPHVALTAEARYNTSFVTPAGSGELVFGVEMGNYIKPFDYAKIKTPVPMDVPAHPLRIRYAARGLHPAAGQLRRQPDGRSARPGDAERFRFLRSAGRKAHLRLDAGLRSKRRAFCSGPAGGDLHRGRGDHLTSTATTTVSTRAATQAQISAFTATPATIQPGQSATLSWSIKNATSASISPSVGSVNPQTGSASVSPTTTTTYTLTATNANGTVTQSVTVTVGLGTPQILRLSASPVNISAGGSSTLSWATNGASTVTISPGVGAVAPNGSTTVKPTTTTTYTLTATSPDGQSVTASVTVTIGTATVQITAFSSSPSFSNSSEPVTLSWQTQNATSVVVTGNGVSPQTLQANGTLVVAPVVTTTYTLTAYGAGGQTVSVTTTAVVR